MDEDRSIKKAQAWILAPLYWLNAATLPSATIWVANDTKNLYKKWVKQASKEMTKNLAKKAVAKKIAKFWAKLWAKHLAWLAPAATWVWAVAVPFVEWALVLDDMRDLYNMAHDDEFKEWAKYIAEDALNFVKENPKETAAAIMSPHIYALYKTVKNYMDKKPIAVATMPDGRTRYSDWSIK